VIEPHLLQEMADEIVGAARPEKVVLFGSHARGDASDDSDIDLLVIQETDLPRPKRSVPLYSILRLYPYSKDIVVYTPEEVDAYRDLPQSFVMTALREGRVLYEK
jgi:predicted nucleotidyltransferase